VGYRFVGWSGDFEGETSNVIHFKADKNYTLKAIFEKSETVSFTVNTEGSGKVYGTTTKRSYTSAPATSYGINTLLALKAVPEEGYAFSHWEGDAEGYNEILDVLADRDMEITAVFKETDICEEFSDDVLSSDWRLALGAEGDMRLSSGKVYFTNWGTRCALLINDSQELQAGEKFDLTVAAQFTSTGTGSGNKGLIVFGYNGEDETAYAIDFTRDSSIRLAKISKAVVSEVASLTSADGIDVTKNMTFNISYDENGLLDVSISQSGTVYTVCEDYELGTGLTGKFGIGGSYIGALSFDKFFMERTETESYD